MMPPYQKVLKLDRCNYVAYMWKHSHLADLMCSMDPTEQGWKEDNVTRKPIWFYGPQLPVSLIDTLQSQDLLEQENLKMWNLIMNKIMSLLMKVMTIYLIEY